MPYIAHRRNAALRRHRTRRGMRGCFGDDATVDPTDPFAGTIFSSNGGSSTPTVTTTPTPVDPNDPLKGTIFSNSNTSSSSSSDSSVGTVVSSFLKALFPPTVAPGMIIAPQSGIGTGTMLMLAGGAILVLVLATRK